MAAERPLDALHRTTSEPSISAGSSTVWTNDIDLTMAALNLPHRNLTDTKTRPSDDGTHIDLRLLDYISEFDQHLACPICRCPFIEPVTLSCSHSYCKLCYYKALEAQSTDIKSCPTCRRSIHDAPLSAPRFVTHMIDDLLVKCPNHASGCQDEIRRCDVQAHINNICAWQCICCPDLDCSQKVPRGKATADCLHVELQCFLCQESMCSLKLDDHKYRHCKVGTFQCQDCNSTLACADRDQHDLLCPDAATTCLASSIGCNTKGLRKTMESHMRDCPLAKLTPFMQSMNRRIDSQTARIHSLQKENDFLEGCFMTVYEQVKNERSDRPSLDSDPYTSGPPQTRAAVFPNGSDQLGDAPFDSPAQHMLSLHESLREELDHVSAALSQVEGKANMTILNETLRIREDMSRQNGAISNLGMQVQWLMQQRLQNQARSTGNSVAVANVASSATAQSASSASSQPLPGQPVRRLSDSARQDVKL